MKIDFMCDKHPQEPAVFVSGYRHCPACSREYDRTIMITWVLNTKRAMTAEKADAILAEMMGTKDYGFSTLPTIYPLYSRGEKDHQGWFVTPQIDYIRNAFSWYMNGGK